MGKKIVDFIKRRADAQVLAYFSSKAYRERLEDCEEELLLRNCSDKVFLAYINRFFLSNTAEKTMLDLRKLELCEAYIEKYGLCDDAQRYMLDRNMLDIASIFFKMREFYDVEYLLGSRNEEMVKIYLEYHALNKDEQVVYLLSYKNLSLFCDYVAKGRVIGDVVKDRVIATENITTFKAVVYHYSKVFREMAVEATNFSWLKEKVSSYGFNATQQIDVLKSEDRMMIEAMLCSMPLEKEAQAYLFEHEFLKQMVQNHVVSLYCIGGYRFEKEYEEKLFKLLNKRSLDDCLMSMRFYDTLTIVKHCSDEHVLGFVKTTWLCDEAQVYLVKNKNEQIVKEFVARFTKDHGMCWQAEVCLVKRNLTELIDLYIKVHTMCGQALQILNMTNTRLYKKYCEIHVHN